MQETESLVLFFSSLWTRRRRKPVRRKGATGSVPEDGKEKEAGSAAGEESQKGAEKESPALFLERGDRRKRVKRPRKSAAMSVDVFCRIAAVWLEERSSSPPCGLGLVSPNLSAASSTW